MTIYTIAGVTGVAAGAVGTYCGLVTEVIPENLLRPPILQKLENPNEDRPAPKPALGIPLVVNPASTLPTPSLTLPIDRTGTLSAPPAVQPGIVDLPGTVIAGTSPPHSQYAMIPGPDASDRGFSGSYGYRRDGFGAAFGGAALGGIVGGVTKARPAAPPPTIYYAPPPPIIYERRVYVPPPPSVTPQSPLPVPVQAVVSTNPVPAPATAVTDLMNGVHEGMPYALARPKLFAAGWQAQFFTATVLSDRDRAMREWFIDHHISEVEDCSSSGCKMQFHNSDGRLLYVYTQLGSHTSGAYGSTGPSVIAWCLDVDNIACPSPSKPVARLSTQVNK